MKTKIFSLGLTLLILGMLQSQVVLMPNSATVVTPEASAVLEVRYNDKGILFPQVPLVSFTDNATVPTPVNGLLTYNTTAKKLNFWEENKWNRNFDIEDASAIIKLTKNFSGSSSSSVTNSTFSNTMPLFNLNDSTAGWINLGTSTTITVTKTTNNNYIITEGMVQINNDSNSGQEFQFAIGVFVNGQLKLARKYTEIGKTYVCNWKKFNLSGVFDDLPIGTHTVSIYGRNLPKITSGYSSITYGGNTSNCSNINNDMARIFVTAQLTQ